MERVLYSTMEGARFPSCGTISTVSSCLVMKLMDMGSWGSEAMRRQERGRSFELLRGEATSGGGDCGGLETGDMKPPESGRPVTLERVLVGPTEGNRFPSFPSP